MKEFISGVAILILLLIFPLQAQYDTVNAYKINRMNDVVYMTAERARFEGRFTTEMIETAKTEIAKAFNVGVNEVTFEGTTTKTVRSDKYSEAGKIHYKYTVPFKNILASAKFLGISDAKNRQLAVKEGFVYSEVLR